MATETVNDWIVSVGMDTSQVDKGAKRVEKIMGRLAKMQAKLNPIGAVSPKVKREQVVLDPTLGQRKPTGPVDQRSKREQDNLRSLNSLESKRLQLLRSIEKAKTLGLKTQGFTQSLRGKNVLRIEQRRLELEKLITQEKSKQKGISAKTQKTAPATTKVGAPVFKLTDERQLKLANTIDSVMRRAARGIDKNSEEFRKLSAEAERLKRAISGVGSKVGLEKLNNQIRILRDNTTSATASSRRLAQQMDSQKFAANSLRNSVRNLGAAYASVFVAIEGAKAFFNTGKEFDSINASLLAASGSYVQAGKDFEFIKDISLGLGIGLKDVATGFAKIGAAGRASGLSTGVIQESFSDISKTVRAFGLSQDRASLVFLGFQQILSKGVVSMQELRQQIGEQLPTAIPIAKKALKEMGSSFTSLDDAVKSGTLSAKEFVPVFARLLRQDVEASGALEASLNTITAAQQRFTSTLDLLTIRAFQAGGKKGLVSFFDNVAMAAENLAPLFRVIGKVVNVVATGLGGLLRVVTILVSPILIITDVLTSLWGVFSDGTKEVDQSAGFFDATIDGMISKIKNLVGWLLVPLGAIEALGLAFESLSDKFDLTTLGGISDAFRLTPQLAGRKALESFGVTFDKPFLPEKSQPTASTVNSGNTITVSIDAAGSNPDELRTTLDEWSQEMFGTAVPSN